VHEGRASTWKLAQAITARLINYDAERGPDFSNEFKKRFNTFYMNKDDDVKSLVKEYFKFVSTIITDIKRNWYEVNITSGVEDEQLVENEGGLLELVARKSRKDYCSDTTLLAMSRNGKMFNLQQATDNFKEAYEASNIFCYRHNKLTLYSAL